ncbi:MAG: laccase domain-containing protein, partial [Actinomycetota bacterium]|nr:laccase domain-containing protein [Actinomycetota bacterium]
VRSGKMFVDLEFAARWQLESQFVSQNRIFTIDACTMSDSSYFSYRRSGGITGRQAAIVALL